MNDFDSFNETAYPQLYQPVRNISLQKQIELLKEEMESLRKRIVLLEGLNES